MGASPTGGAGSEGDQGLWAPRHVVQARQGCVLLKFAAKQCKEAGLDPMCASHKVVMTAYFCRRAWVNKLCCVLCPAMQQQLAVIEGAPCSLRPG